MKRFIFSLCLLPLAAMAETNQIVVYDSYGSAERVVVEGRVVEFKAASAAAANDGWFSNLRRTVSAMMNSEKEKVDLTVSLPGVSLAATTDEEGYFSVVASPKALPPGWQTVAATTGAKGVTGTGRMLLVSPANTHGVISDIDDTVVVSDVLDKKKLLENTFLQNPLQRKTFPGTADFYKRLLAANPEPNGVPMFYLSASPRQLAASITAFLDHNQFPQGALIAKRISGDAKDPLLDQEKYKLAKIAAIFAAVPWVKFTLVGDDGEKDPEIYRAIQEKFPTRVANIYIRNVNPDPLRAKHPGQLDLAAAVAK